jgi:transposase
MTAPCFCTKTFPPRPNDFLQAIAPYRDGLVVGCECMFAWYWVIHDIRRFPDVGQFLSYARLVRCAHESAGKKKGSGGKGAKKIGNAHLRWAFAEAVCLWLRQSDRAKAWMKRHEKKRGKAKTLAILGAKLARAMYHMLRKKKSSMRPRSSEVDAEKRLTRPSA